MLDWPHAIVADPAFDVATTLVILKLVPMGVSGLAAPLRWLASAARPLLVGSYLRHYRRRRPLDERQQQLERPFEHGRLDVEARGSRRRFHER